MGNRRRRARVLYVQYTNPAAYPPVDHSAELLADAGFDVLVLGTRSADDPLELTGHPGVRVLTMRAELPGWRQKLHYARFAAWALGWTARWRPDWVYASDPPSCPIALLADAVPGVRVLYHEHDSPTLNDSGQVVADSLAVRMFMRARKALANRCELAILPNAARAATYTRTTGREDVVTVWNTPLRREVASVTRTAAASRLRVLYHGSLVPARLPLTVVDALAMLPEAVTLELAGYETIGHPGYVGQLAARAAQHGIAHRIHAHGAVPLRRDLMQLCAGCDVGLALLPSDSSDINEQAMVGASNKPFDYMAGGLALLVSTLPEWKATYAEQGFGVTCDPQSAESVAAALRWLLDHPAERLEMGRRGQLKILGEWNYERCFAPVLDQVRTVAYAG